MDKCIKYVCYILLLILIIDTLQAKFFNNSPFLRISEKKEDGTRIDKGILVDTYIYDNKLSKKTFFKWEKDNKMTIEYKK